jgi:hypothetical protein
MRSRVIFLFALVLACAFFVAADAPTVDLSGDWVLDLRHSSGSESYIISNRQIDPGIGWPPGVGPKGAPTKGRVGISLLREGGPDLRLHIVQTANEIQVARHFTVAGNKQEVKQCFDLNGRQKDNPAPSGYGNFVSTSTWEKGSLVNWGTITARQSLITVKEEYRISSDGKKLTLFRSGFYNMSPSSPARDSQKPDVTDSLAFKRK